MRARCKGSRQKTYTNAYRAAWKFGEVISDPEAVYLYGPLPEAAADADPRPGQPIVFDREQKYRWGSWVCFFCQGVNPPESA